MPNAIVTNIQGYSIHDGPGIRTVVFLKGCPLRCKWCANPENLENKVQVGFIKTLCKQCGRCASGCEHGAILSEPDRRIDRGRCVGCAACVDKCFYEALKQYGTERSSEEVFDQVRRDKMFYDTSGGGVTVSGGEPLTHPDFVEDLFRRCHEEEINTCVETCGCVSQSAFEQVLPVTDIFYFDLKIMNPITHIVYTGVNNEKILNNARFLAESGAKILFRQPFIPGINATGENMEATAEFIRELNRPDLALQLMPYHRMGVSKYEALDKQYEVEDIQIMSEEELKNAVETFTKLGVNCSVSK